jgi:tol-pal system protein YbgF
MTMHTKHRIAALLLAAAMAGAHAGVFDDTEARKAILELRAKVDAMHTELTARLAKLDDAKMDKTQALDFNNQREADLAELARLRGQVEVLQNALAQADKHGKELYADLDARLKKLEPQQVTIDGQTTEVDPGEQKAYESAMATFKGGDYAAAARELGDFVHRYPSSGFAANAQYWLGNAYYAAQNYKAAITAQQVVVSDYADSPKAPDALLNIASSHLELKQKWAAKKALQQLVAKYPDSSAAATARDRLKALK